MVDSRSGVLIAVSQPLLARGLASLARDEVGVPVFQSAGRPETLGSEIVDYRPRLVIVGVANDNVRVRDHVSIIRAVDVSCRIALLAPRELRMDPLDLVRLDISSIISRDGSLDEIVVAIRQALAGRIAIDSATASRLLRDLTKTTPKPSRVHDSNALTRRELQVLELVADGLQNRDVAMKLHISENTVKNHMRSIHEKLDVRTRTEAVVKAARHGLLGIK